MQKQQDLSNSLLKRVLLLYKCLSKYYAVIFPNLCFHSLFTPTLPGQLNIGFPHWDFKCIPNKHCRKKKSLQTSDGTHSRLLKNLYYKSSFYFKWIWQKELNQNAWKGERWLIFVSSLSMLTSFYLFFFYIKTVIKLMFVFRIIRKN